MGVPTLPAVRSDRARFTEIAETLGSDLPIAVGRIGALADRATQLLTDDNVANVASALASVARFTATLEETGPDLDETVATLRGTGASIEAAVGRLDGLLADNADGVGEVLANLAGAGAAITATARQLDGMIAENRRDLRSFTGDGLAEVQSLAVEAQAMARAIERVARRLESEGAGFLLGTETIPEYQPRTR